MQVVSNMIISNLVHQQGLHQKNETQSTRVKLNRCGIRKYHTIHTRVLGIMKSVYVKKTPIYTTLPSNADFEVYIKGFPKMQVNIICDSHGYYIVDVLKSVYNRTTPLPEAVYEYMRKLRSRPFMRIGAFSEDGVEYFHTTLQNWKRYMNEDVNPEMIDLFGISIQYYGYDDDPPNVTIYRGIDVA